MLQRAAVLGAFVSVLACVSSCKPQMEEPVSSLREDDPSASANDCGGEAMAQRRKAVFDRTVSCAADAAGIKAAEAVRSAVVGVHEIGKLVRAIQAVRTANGLSPLNVAKTTLCFKVLADNVTQNTIKNTVDDAARLGLSESDDAELKSLGARLGQYLTFDTIETFSNLGKLISEPGVQNFAKFAASALQTGGDWASVITACGQVFASASSVVAPNVVQISRSINSLQTLGTVGALVGCSAAVVFNTVDVVNESACLYNDIKELNASRRAVQRALAYVGSRQYNHARYTGCTQCVKARWQDSTETEYRNCRSCCENQVGNFVSERQSKKRANWVTSCQLTCGVAKTSGFFRDYTDEATCNELKNMYHVSRTYRPIYVLDLDKVQDVEERRAQILAYLELMEANFATLDTGSGVGGPDGKVSHGDVVAVYRRSDISKELKDALYPFAENAWIGVSGRTTPYMFGLLDGAGDGGREDGLFVQDELRWLRDEVKEYRAEVEFE